ncbi:MAG: tetratricopeptide repeat protein [Planctomyces sp.]|nr:tetratricopeptide repeat protein [Planctomyces sp.]
MTRMQLTEVLRTAKKSLDQGNLYEAQQWYEQAIRIAPASFEANFHLSVVYHDLGQRDAAIQCLRKVVEVRSSSIEGWFNLGSMLQLEGRFREAEDAYREVIRLNPVLPEAHNNLGIVVRELGDLEAAVACFQEAVRLRPDMSAGWHNIGTVSIKLRDADRAVFACERAKALAPQSPEIRFAAGLAYELAGNRELADKEWSTAIQLRPEVSEWRYHRAAAQGGSAPPSAPKSYIRDLFDAYAARFDSHLKGRLQYQTPELLFEAAALGAEKDLKILDLGCGTGLCGRLFKDAAAQLIGVDLSPAMIHEAELTQTYHELHVADLVEYMDTQDRHFDLVLASDVFIYIGELGGVFRAVGRILKPGGKFVFSTEAVVGISEAEEENRNWDPEVQGFVLNTTRRYSHHRPYLQALGQRSGFRTGVIRRAELRRQAGEMVEGWIVVLIKTAE